MATVIDALIVTLGLDPRDLQKGSAKAQYEFKKTRDEATKDTKAINEQGKKAAEFFSNVRKEVTALFTAFAGGVGLTSFIMGTAKANTSLGLMADNLGVNRQELWAWGQMAKAVGGTAEDATAAFQTLANMRWAEKRTPGQFAASMGPILTALGIPWQDVQKPPADFMMEIERVLKQRFPGAENRAERLQWWQKLGLSTTAFNIAESPNARQQLAAYQQEAPSDADVAKAEAFSAAWAKVLATLTNVRNTVGTALLGPLGKFADLANDLAKRHLPVLVGAVGGLTAAMVVLGIAMLPVDGPILVVAGGVALLGAAAGALWPQLRRLGEGFVTWLRSAGPVQDLLRGVRSAVGELGASLGSLFQALAPIGDALGRFANAIANALGPNIKRAVEAYLVFAIDKLHALADAINIVTALLNRDPKGARKAAHDFAADMTHDIWDSGPARASGQHAGQMVSELTGSSGSVADRAMRMIAGFEGFLGQARWDVNHFRAGFGSSTTTDARTGRVTEITASTHVSREDAEADLKRRVASEFLPRTALAVGTAWKTLSDSTKAVLVSLAYNYGRLPRDILAAARTGNAQAIAAAIRAHRYDNHSVNYRRREQEADAVESTPARGSNQNLPAANSNAAQIASVVRPIHSAADARTRAATASFIQSQTTHNNSTDVQINGGINIHTPATDSKGIASTIGPAIQKRTYAVQGNTGLF